MKKYTVTAHTGNMGTKDNSLESIRAAAETGADIIEFDLLCRRDGTPVMRHSRPITRWTKTVKAGFEEIKKTNLLINIDVKEPKNLDKVIALADEMGLKDRCFFTGIFEKDVPEVKKQCPDIKFYINVGIDGDKKDDDEYIASVTDMLKKTGAVGINDHYPNVSQKMIDAVHAAGFEVSVWTLNNLEDYKRISKMGVDNITTRFPSYEKEV